jgi:hypothetical protein
MSSIEERYAKQIVGRLECLDRVVIRGTLPGVCYAQGMTSWLYEHNIRIFDYLKVVEPLRDKIRQNAEELAAKHGMEVTYLKKKIRKEAHVQKILKERGSHPGLVCILAVVEICPCYKPWHNKQTGQNYVQGDTAKCLHYYFYFIDRNFGLCYLRVPTWAPFCLQFYFNGHDYLARRLDAENISYTMQDNAFLEIGNWKRAQRIADTFPVRKLHKLLDRVAKRFCPIQDTFTQAYHWSLMQVEFASDLVFRRRQDLAPLYEHLTQVAIQAVKAENVSTFLGRKLHGNFTGELTGRLQTRIQGTCIKHWMDQKAGLKMYDKHGLILRLETTVNDVSFFKHYREVEHRDGSTSFKQAPLRKTIYSLPTLMKLMKASNGRYRQFLSEMDDPTAGLKHIHRIADPAKTGGRNQRGFNLLSREDHNLFVAIARGEFHIQGFTNKALRRLLPHNSGSQMSRLLKRLRAHGLIKKVGRSYKYYFTKLGRATIAAALKLRELIIVPALAESQQHSRPFCAQFH